MFLESFNQRMKDFKENMALSKLNFNKIILKKIMERLVGGLCQKERSQKMILQENNAKGLSYYSERRERQELDKRDKEVRAKELNDGFNMPPLGTVGLGTVQERGLSSLYK